MCLWISVLTIAQLYYNLIDFVSLTAYANSMVSKIKVITLYMLKKSPVNPKIYQLSLIKMANIQENINVSKFYQVIFVKSGLQLP